MLKSLALMKSVFPYGKVPLLFGVNLFDAMKLEDTLGLNDWFFGFEGDSSPSLVGVSPVDWGFTGGVRPPHFHLVTCDSCRELHFNNGCREFRMKGTNSFRQSMIAQYDMFRRFEADMMVAYSRMSRSEADEILELRKLMLPISRVFNLREFLAFARIHRFEDGKLFHFQQGVSAEEVVLDGFSCDSCQFLTAPAGEFFDLFYGWSAYRQTSASHVWDKDGEFLLTLGGVENIFSNLHRNYDTPALKYLRKLRSEPKIENRALGKSKVFFDSVAFDEIVSKS